VNDHVPSTRRSVRGVLDSHLHYVMTGDLEGDLAENYAPAVVLLTAEGITCGPEGLRELARILRTYDRDASYKCGQIWLAGEIALVPWTVTSAEVAAYDGADTLLIRDGHIWTQTSHYSIHGR
jgi:hypothetical protein